MGDGPVVVEDVTDDEVVEEAGPEEAFEDHSDDVIEEVVQ